MRVFAGGDTHCGHLAGLTPPVWQINEEQQQTWQTWKRLTRRRRPFDVAIFNGDLIDGKGERSGGTEIFVPDRLEQARMAAACIESTGATRVLLTRGTPYHTGQHEDWEDVLVEILESRGVHTTIKDHLFARLGGVNFSARHKVGGSQAGEHTRFTAIARERMWDRVWAQEKEQHPASQVILRSHVHYHNYCGKGGKDWWLAMTLPALQGLGSKFGSRQCSGTVDWGYAWLDVERGKVVRWDAEIEEIEAMKDRVVVVE